MSELPYVPVYIVTGFLDSGKTTMVTSMLMDQDFTDSRKVLVLCCEEGETEYDEKQLRKHNAEVCYLDGPEELNSGRLREIVGKYTPSCVLIEYNSMWGMDALFKCKFPPAWELVQVIGLVDATTMANYMTNMRKQMSEPLKEADLILINRCTPDFEKPVWRRQLRVLNPTCNILFEAPDGSTDDGVTDEDLPYDMKADIITIPEDQYGIFYMDSMDHPDRYDGRTVRLVGQPFPNADVPDGYYLFGRYAMTCCANDVQVCGWFCRGEYPPDENVFIALTAVCHVVSRGDQSMIMLEEKSAKKVPPTFQQYVTFGTI